MKAYVYDAVRSAVPQLELDELYVRKTEVARIVQQDLQDRISFFGFDIVSILIVYLKPDLKVKASINESHAAAKLRIAATEIAEANKLTIIKQAEAQAHRLVLEGYGIAQQMQAIMRGFKEDNVKLQKNLPNVDQQQVKELLLMQYYADTIHNIGTRKETDTYFLPCVVETVDNSKENPDELFRVNEQQNMSTQ